MITARHTWVGFVILFLVALLIVVAAMYWQHVTGTNLMHLLAEDQSHGC
jgi:hypothetical protein